MAVADLDFEPYWDATARGELAVQECGECGTRRWPPRAACAKCGSARTCWAAIEGRGRIYSWVVLHRTSLLALQPRLPFPVVIVELDGEHPVRFVGGMTSEDSGAELSIGLPVEVQFHHDDDGRTRPYWSVAT